LFHRDLQPVRGVLVGAASLQFAYLGRGPEQCLHVVSDLVRDDVGLREISWSPMRASSRKKPRSM